MKKTKIIALTLAAALLGGCGSLDNEKVDAKITLITAAEDDSVDIPDADLTSGSEAEITENIADSADTSRDTDSETEPAETSSEKTTTTAAATTTTTVVATAATTTTTTVTTTTEAVPDITVANDEPDVTTTEYVPVDDGTYEVIGENGILVIKRDGHYMGLMACWGTYGLCDGYISAVNKFAAALPGVNFYNMVIPTSVEYYLPSTQSGFTADQKKKIDYIAEGIKGITDVPVYDILGDHADECIFARTDHHWLPLGAYYAAEKFASVADISFPALSEYTPVTLGGYVGSMYSYSKDTHLYYDPEDFTMYISPNDKSLKTTYYNTYFSGAYASDLFVARNASAYYCSFLGSDDRIAKIETNAGSGRTLVMFKESYGNALVPFLTSGYDTIYVCDIRYFNINAVSFCKDVGATDVLFSTCTFTPAGGNGKYFNYIQQY